ncbi:MAG: hypothetical protein ACOYN4_04860, partial [Bacteroidales bacterium]
EGKQSIVDIQNKFKELSQKEILKSTAYAINMTANRVQGHIRQQIRKEYTISNKWLMKDGKSDFARITKLAAGEPSRLYAHVGFSYKPVPMIYFKHTGTVGEIYNIKTKQLNPINVTIKKGQTKVFRHAFIKVKKSGGEGIFAYGKYQGKEFVYNKESRRQSELKTASPFTMAFSKGVQPKVNDFIAKELPGRLHAMLEKKLKKISK